ncbi:MAG: hypothetical protein JNK09_10760 [Prolixibacteraceae bacterium]|nr:hypothetical protein [Prolixibacteraceae bacterium]
MKQLIGCLLISSFLLFLSEPASAQNQQDSTKTRVETIDGNEFIGIVLEKNTDFIRLKTDNLGEITIKMTAVKKVSEIGPVLSKDGVFWLDNPQATRYFWAPNGYNLKAGEGYYQNVWVMFNQAIFGLTDHFSAGVGLMPLFLFPEAPTPVWLTAKFSYPIIENKFNLGAGALAGTVIGEDGGGFGILYGISTFGSKDQNLNIGLGWAFAGGEMANRPTVNISAMFRTGARGYFITENYFISTSDEFVAMIMLGGRRIIKRTGLDFGVVIPLASEMDGFVAVPWLGFTVPF